MALRDLLVVLDCVHIDIAERAHRIFLLAYRASRLLHVAERRISVLSRALLGEIIFTEDVRALRIPLLGLLVPLRIHAEQIFFELGAPRRDFIPLLKAFLLLAAVIALLGLKRLQFALQGLKRSFESGQRLLLFGGAPLFLGRRLSRGLALPLERFDFGSVARDLIGDTAQIFAEMPLLLTGETRRDRGLRLLREHGTVGLPLFVEEIL